VTDSSGVTALVAGCSKLREVSFAGVPGLTEGVVSVIAAHYPLLRELCFSQCAAIRRFRTA
jgi:hypothetical protein